LFSLHFLRLTLSFETKIVFLFQIPSPDGSGILLCSDSGAKDITDSRIKLLKKQYQMKNSIQILFLSFLFVACQQKIKKEDIAKINGYWEIEKVAFKAGEDKDYMINESYDYFQIGKDFVGFRNKVMPQLDGTFVVNDTYENVKVRFVDDKVYFDYSTEFAQWTEELVVLEKDKLTFRNAENKEYFYKRATPIKIEGNGQKTK
jgi:hypothetical protein